MNYLRYDKGKRKVYNIDTDKILRYIVDIDFNGLYPSGY
jgi:hypothetical protein